MGHVKAAFFGRRTFAVELYLAIQAAAFGLWLLAPWGSFLSAEHHRTMAVVPELVWGLLFLTHGLLHIRALDRADKNMRRRGTTLVVLLWLIVLASLLSTAPLSPDVPLYAAPVLFGLWAHVAQSRWRVPE